MRWSLRRYSGLGDGVYSDARPVPDVAVVLVLGPGLAANAADDAGTPKEDRGLEEARLSSFIELLIWNGDT